MKRSKCSEEQIVYDAIRQANAGTPIGDLCRQLGVSDATFYAWKKRYAYLEERATPAPAVGRRKQSLETVGRRPLARQAHALGGPAKKSLRPARRRELAAWFQGTLQVSCLRACRLAQFSRAA